MKTSTAELERSVTLVGADCATRRPCVVGRGVELAHRYILGAALGEGGSGVVFRAWDAQLACAVALKLFDPDTVEGTAGMRRLRREVRLARGVRHRNVCSVYDLGHAQGRWFVTMELAAGTMRDEIVGAPRPDGSDWARRVRDAREVCAGLAAVHEERIIHADVTPRNVLRMMDGRVALADFGLAWRDGDATDARGGTLSYLPPEVALGARPDWRSDVWQLGVVLHELLLGARLRWRMARGRPVAEPEAGPRPPAAVASLLAVAASCLAWDPAERPASAVEIAACAQGVSA